MRMMMRMMMSVSAVYKWNPKANVWKHFWKLFSRREKKLKGTQRKPTHSSFSENSWELEKLYETFKISLNFVLWKILERTQLMRSSYQLIIPGRKEFMQSFGSSRDLGFTRNENDKRDKMVPSKTEICNKTPNCKLCECRHFMSNIHNVNNPPQFMHFSFNKVISPHNICKPLKCS